MGNWKMNKTIAEAKQFALASKKLSAYASKNNVDIGVAPVYLGLSAVKEANPDLFVAAQNVSQFPKGAYTGEISIPMLQELGIDWVLIGHSERRSYYGETNEACNAKIHALIENNITPLYCVGETLSEFDAGLTKEVVKRQIEVGLAGLTASDVNNLVVAYEPVWSIGTGKNASKEIAEDVCHYIRGLLFDLFGDVANKIRILYGGSVKPNNIKEYLSAEDIDGALVGGASLDVNSYEELVRNIVE